MKIEGLQGLGNLGYGLRVFGLASVSVGFSMPSLGCCECHSSETRASQTWHSPLGCPSRIPSSPARSDTWPTETNETGRKPTETDRVETMWQPIA